MNTAVLDEVISVIRCVTLLTRDATRMAQFYSRLLGLTSEEEAGPPSTIVMRHPVSGEVLLKLVEDPKAPSRNPVAPGLFHAAFLFGRFEDWVRAMRLALSRDMIFHGAADHGVSWAGYLADPDGNGVELAWDKPADEWPWKGDRIQMVSKALPLRDILGQGTDGGEELGRITIGHIHLQVPDLSFGRFYQENLGLRITQSDYPGALFLARNGYHHHLALNVWAVDRRVPQRPGSTGLLGWEMTGAQGLQNDEWEDLTGAQVRLID